jgi:hypothetical protein
MEERKTTKVYMPNGLRLVDGTTVVSDLVTDLQREMILFVAGPNEGVYLSLYRNGRELCYWRTTEKLSYKQLSATPHQHRMLVYPEDRQGQYEVVRTLILDSFFVPPTAEDGPPGDQKPAGAVSLTTVREINRALRAYAARTGGRVCCFREGSPGVVQVFHAKQPRGDSLKVTGSNGHWFTPEEVWVEL